jgi:hypothetical protein
MMYTAREIGEAKRELVLDLLECRKDPSVTPCLVSSAQVKAIRLTQAGVDWRKHTVRSKLYKGTLGSLYDEFKPYQSSSFIEV